MTARPLGDRTTAPDRVDVCVVGVANVDLVVQVPTLPGPGSTVFGKLQVRPGGKGFNQAVAAAAAGARTALVAQAGDDDWGRQLRHALIQHGVDIGGFNLLPGNTAAVIVQIPSDGESAVTVTRTSTTLHRRSTIAAAEPLLQAAHVTVVQLELDVDVIAATLEVAAGRVIGTLAPQAALPAAVLERLDAIVVNAAEAATMLDLAPAEVVADPAGATRALRRIGPATALITLGAGGAAYTGPDGEYRLVEAPRVPVVDTTGAGDAVLGAVAAALAQGLALADAVALGVSAGSRTVSRMGATG